MTRVEDYDQWCLLHELAGMQPDKGRGGMRGQVAIWSASVISL